MPNPKASIILTAEDRTKAAFASAERGLKGMQQAASRINGLLATLGVGIAGGGLAAFAKQAIDSADNLAKLSQRIGISVEQLAGYRLATDLSGVSMEQFGTAAGILSQKLAANDKILQQLGIQASNADEALQQLADLFQRMPDGAQKTAIAMRLMGESGARMIPLLNGGGDALRRMLDEGRALYPVTTEMARASEQFNDSLTRLKTSAEGVGVRLANSVLPFMQKMLDNLSQAATLSSRHGGFISLVLNGTNPTGDIGRELRNVNARIKAITDNPRLADPTGLGLSADNAQAELARLRALKQTLQEIQRQQALALGAPYADYKQRKPIAALPSIDLGGGGAAGKGGSKAASDAMRRRIEAQNTEFERAMELEDYRIEQQTRAMLEARDNALAETDRAFEQDAERLDMAERQAAALGRMRDEYLGLIDPVQQYRVKLDEIQKLGEMGLLDPDQVTEATFAINEQIDSLNGVGDKLQNARDFAKDFGLTFNSALEDALINGKKFSDVLKALEKDIARIIIRKSVTEPLANALGGWLGGIFTGGKAAPIVEAVPMAHSGGILGADRLATRLAAPGLWLNAPRFHSGGLVGGEVPIIAKRGEGVFTPEQMRRLGPAGGNVTMNFNVDARGADAGVVARLETSVRALAQNLKPAAVQAVREAMIQNRVSPAF